MSNRYDILYRLPGYRAHSVPYELELLAGQLVGSGLLRIKADHARNFAPYSGSGFDMSFSWRELTDPNLLPETREAIARTLPGSAGAEELLEIQERLMRACKSADSISLEREMEIARLLVQATQPIVIELLLLERVNLFVSYSHDVSDLFPVHFWEQTGHSSGLQSVSGDGTAVYVSCGGNPFIEEEDHKTYVSDGFAALARMQVIAAQELGHYADLQRNAGGRIISRHSAHLAPLRAKEAYATARLQDMQQVAKLQKILTDAGVPALAEKEKRLAFFAQHRKNAPVYWFARIHVWRHKRALLKRTNHRFVQNFPKQLHGANGWAIEMLACLQDMQFNLAPQADAYQSDDAAEEEAIACIEALARVPQQSVKWGRTITQLCWQNLFALYYEEVIPANIAAYEAISGKQWHFPKLIPPKSRNGISKFKRLILKK